MLLNNYVICFFAHDIVPTTTDGKYEITHENLTYILSYADNIGLNFYRMDELVDPAYNVSLSNTAIIGNDGQDVNVNIQVSRIYGYPINVTVMGIDDTAIVEVDYTPGIQTVTIPAHATNVNSTIHLIRNNQSTGDKQFSIVLSNSTKGVELGEITKTNITIKHDILTPTVTSTIEPASSGNGLQFDSINILVIVLFLIIVSFIAICYYMIRHK